MLLAITYFDSSEKLKRPPIRSQTEHRFTTRTVLTSSDNKSMSLRTKYDSEKKIKKIKEYCKNEMSKNYYLRLANEQYTGVKGDFPGHNGHVL